MLGIVFYVESMMLTLSLNDVKIKSSIKSIGLTHCRVSLCIHPRMAYLQMRMIIASADLMGMKMAMMVFSDV